MERRREAGAVGEKYLCLLYIGIEDQNNIKIQTTVAFIYPVLPYYSRQYYRGALSLVS
jgi:hypothetical protein